MFGFEQAITDGTKKPPAAVTRHDGFFLGMIKTARFAIYHDGFSRLANAHFTEQCRKNFHLQWHSTGGTGRKVRLIEGT